MKKRERGAITIEATLVLTMFMFAIVTILTVIDICLAQARIGIAIDATAKEISQYSYLYGLTGLGSIKNTLVESSLDTADQIDTTAKGINDIFNAIEDMGETGRSTDITNPKSLTETWGQLKTSTGEIKASASQIKGIAESVKNDPKSFIFGIAKIASNELLDLGTSRFIADPVSRAMIEKHLKSSDNQDVESYLKKLRVVPGEDGTYMSGLDFSDSLLFPLNSDDIIITVKYKIKVVPLLPVNMEYTFRQVAITKGWLGGSSYKTKSAITAVSEKMFEENKSEWWISADPYKERGPYMRDRFFEENKNYHQVKGGFKHTDGFDPDNNEFVIVGSSNLLYSDDPKNPKKVSDITDAELKECLDRFCDPFNAELDNLSSVTYSDKNQKQTKELKDGYTKKLVLIIPEDEGLEERYNDYIKNKYNSGGVEIVIQKGYGKGASAIEVENPKQ